MFDSDLLFFNSVILFDTEVAVTTEDGVYESHGSDYGGRDTYDVFHRHVSRCWTLD